MIKLKKKKDKGPNKSFEKKNVNKDYLKLLKIPPFCVVDPTLNTKL